MQTLFKRYCTTMELCNDQLLIETYKKAHAKGAAWPEITQSMKEVGIIDMEIYLLETKLFMIIDTTADFDHDKAMTELALKPGQKRMGRTHVAISGQFCQGNRRPKMAIDGADL